MARVGIIGAGIIGSAIAAWLISEGHAVTIFEADPEGLPTSSGNAALLAFPEIAPIASPGILSSVPGWLLDPLGPLALRWTDLPALTPWLLAFLRNANPIQARHARAALGWLMQTALVDHQRLAEITGHASHLRQTGYLSIYDSENSLSAAEREATLVEKELGFGFERLSAEEARKLVPQLEGPFFGAVYQPVYWMVSNPLAVLRHVQAHVNARSELVKGRVKVIEPGAAGVTVLGDAGRSLTFDKVVVAAGIWSRDLVRLLGLKLLLEPERGYNTTFTDLSWTLPMPVGFGEHGFIASPLSDGLRVGGAVELARPEAPPNFARAKAMRSKMRRYVPALPEGGTEWMGRRPSTPDSVPVISRHPSDPRIVFAFGHGHLGLTLSAVTGRLVAGLIADEQVPPALAPFSISRFQ